MDTEVAQGNEPTTTTSEGAENTNTQPQTTESATTTPGEGGAGEPAAYTPNLKFKFRDASNSQVEKEFDPWVKDVIKDANTEKAVRELYEKAHGLDFVKAERQTLRESFEDVNSKWTGMSKTLEQLGSFVRAKDYESFFENLKIPEEDILKYAMKRIQLREMSPEQRQQYEASRQERQRLYELENQNRDLQQGWTTHATQVRTQELEQNLMRPEVSQAAQAFEARIGQPGAFRAEVIRRGQYYHQAFGMDISAEQAVQEVLALVGGLQQASPQQVIPAQPQAAPQVSPPAPQAKPPVIPNIQGRGGSPVKKVVRSIDDLKARANELAAQGR